MLLCNYLGSDSYEGLTLETSAEQHIPQTKNIPYQPLLIKPMRPLRASMLPLIYYVLFCSRLDGAIPQIRVEVYMSRFFSNSGSLRHCKKN